MAAALIMWCSLPQWLHSVELALSDDLAMLGGFGTLYQSGWHSNVLVLSTVMVTLSRYGTLKSIGYTLWSWCSLCMWLRSGDLVLSKHLANAPLSWYSLYIWLTLGVAGTLASIGYAPHPHYIWLTLIQIGTLRQPG